MYKGKKIAVIIAAAGMGKRMGADVPKQFLEINGRPMLAETAEVFAADDFVDAICVVTGASDVERCHAILKGMSKIKYIVPGGKERQDSISCGLSALCAAEEFDIVLIHDAARPYVTSRLIEDCIEKALQVGACTAAVPVKDTIRYRNMTLERKDMYAVQTPQAFEKSIILSAYERAYSDGFYGTDDAGLVERMGRTVAIVEGDYKNIKITTPEDLPASCGGSAGSQAFLKNSAGSMRIGSGFDVHAFAEGRALILGGVDIPHTKGLLGHSDADVLTHAVMDALLGAAALGDIGRHFPDTDERYKGISSLLLLEHVRTLLEKAGYIVGNIDVTLIAQKPKIAPYIQQMTQNLAKSLGIEENRINIKGTTTEKLGFTGREEGIACEAVCMIYSRI